MRRNLATTLSMYLLHPHCSFATRSKIERSPLTGTRVPGEPKHCSRARALAHPPTETKSSRAARTARMTRLIYASRACTARSPLTRDSRRDGQIDIAFERGRRAGRSSYQAARRYRPETSVARDHRRASSLPRSLARSPNAKRTWWRFYNARTWDGGIMSFCSLRFLL